MINILNGIWKWCWNLVKGKPDLSRTFWFHAFVGFQILLPIIIGQISVILFTVPKELGIVIMAVLVLIFLIYVTCVSIGVWRAADKDMAPELHWTWRWMARGYLLICAYAIILKLLRLS